MSQDCLQPRPPFRPRRMLPAPTARWANASVARYVAILRTSVMPNAAKACTRWCCAKSKCRCCAKCWRSMTATKAAPPSRSASIAPPCARSWRHTACCNSAAAATAAHPDGYNVRLSHSRKPVHARSQLVPVRRALLSVSDNIGLIDLGRRLAARGIELLSTGGSAKALREAGITVTDVSDLTGFPEIMDGRVKTLHPKVHGGLLGRRGTDDAVMAELGIAPIDLLVLNLYPFSTSRSIGAMPSS